MIRDKDQEKQDKKYSMFVRKLGVCIMQGSHNVRCQGDIQSCHIRLGSHCGVGQKPRKREVPMCYAHHAHQHQIGEASFWGDLLDHAVVLASDLYDRVGNKDSALKLLDLFRWTRVGR